MSDRLNILHIILSLEFGGAEKMLVNMCNRLVGEHRVTICCIKKTGALCAELDPGVGVVCLGQEEGVNPLLTWRLLRLMRRGRFDVVHTHNWSVFVESGLAATLVRAPVLVHTAHGRYAPLADNLATRLKIGLRHALERRLARRFTGIVSVSESIRESITASVGIGGEHVQTIHNGIDPGERLEARQGQELRFIAVGRLVPIKYHDAMVKAFSAIAGSCPQARLLIVGDGPERARLEEAVREAGISSRVDLPGFRQDVSGLLAASDVFLLTSGYEGISIALLEAMRAGLPTIATRVGGVPETVIDGMTGILVEPGDAEGLVRAMLTLCRQREQRIRMGREARIVLERQFSLERMLARYRLLYGEGRALHGARRWG